MKPLEAAAVGFYIVVAMFTLYFLIKVNVNPPVRHNICTIAEISPDITPEERKRCQQMRGHKL